MKIEDLVGSTGEWLKGAGRRCEIVISSRVRLARNLEGHRFPPSCDAEEKARVAEEITAALGESGLAGELSLLDLGAMDELDRRFLLERHLISREHEEGGPSSYVAVRGDETVSVMVNEEDHLRLQSLQSGLQLEEAYRILAEVDRRLETLLAYAWDDAFGYLTSCPTNVGTGLRASVMVHLPALVMTRHIEKAFRAINELNLAVRGLYGEGTEAHGDFYQISNQVTMGRDEEEILGDLSVVIDKVVEYEAAARATLREKEPARLEDRVWRSYGVLGNARIISSEEAMRHLSSLRLGRNTGILPELETRALNEMFIFSQPAHLQKLEGRALSADERDIQRATLIRERLTGRTP